MVLKLDVVVQVVGSLLETVRYQFSSFQYWWHGSWCCDNLEDDLSYSGLIQNVEGGGECEIVLVCLSSSLWGHVTWSKASAWSQRTVVNWACMYQLTSVNNVNVLLLKNFNEFLDSNTVTDEVASNNSELSVWLKIRAVMLGL